MSNEKALDLTAINYDNEVDFSPKDDTTLNANFLMWLTDEQYQAVADRAGITVDWGGDNIANVYADITKNVFDPIENEDNLIGAVSLMITYTEDGKEQVVKGIELTVEEKREIFPSMKEYSAKEGFDLLTYFKELQAETLNEIGNNHGNCITGSLHEFIDGIGEYEQDGKAVKYASVVLDDKIYDELAKRVNLYEDAEVSGYSEMLNTTDITIDTTAEFVDGEFSCLVLDMQRETSFSGNYLVPLSDSDRATLLEGFKAYEKELSENQLEAANELFKGSRFYEEIIYGEDDKGIYVNFTGEFLDKVYNEFAYRTGLYEDCKIENYDTLLNDSDATLSLYMNVYESDAISVTLSLQSEMYGYKDYDVPLNKGEEKALISLAEEYASKENTSLAVLMAEAKSAYGNEINSHNFINDAEKMRDFPLMSKEDFLASYSYLTDAEYNNTLELYQEKYLDILNTMGYKLIQNENGEYSVYDVHYGEFLKAENGNTLILDNAGHLFNALYETFDENYLAELAFDYTDYGIGDDAPSNFMNWIDFASKCIDGNCTADEKALYEAHKNDLDAIFVMGGGYDKIDLDKVYDLSEEKGAWKGIDPEYNEKLFIETLAAMKISLTNSENGINLYDNELNEHFDDDGEICCFSSAGDIFERLDSYISDYFIGYMSSEFRENNMSGEMPSSCEEWANYGIHCQYGTPQEQEFFKAHEKDIEMINLIANDFEEVDLQKAVEITEKSREDQKHTPNKKKNDYTDRE